MKVDFTDLRDWIEIVDGMGELARIDGAHWELEIGGLAALQEHRVGNPALLFDRVPGYSPGQRVLTNTMMSNSRVALTLGAPVDSDPISLVRYWRSVAKDLPTTPVTVVEQGPIDEHVMDGDDVDVLAFPTPRWHEDDGGRYIGTGCVVAMHDPDNDWVNLGTYRVMIQDSKRVGIHISPGKQGRLIRDAFWSRGEPCPVAISVGQDPLLTSLGGIEVPYGVSEYEVAGGIRGAGTEVIVSDLTGLPIPARAEIVLEGFMHEGDTEEEGPFGEWSGYYAGGRRPSPVVNIERIRHRTDPILLGSLTSRSPADAAYYRGILRAAMIWDQLEAAGMTGINGVWVHEASGSRMWVTISITQKHAGHSKQVGMIASQCHAGAYANRYVVVVDDDIDITDDNDLVWALCTRVDPRHDFNVLEGNWSSPLDPMAYPRENPRFNARVVIDACRPWERLESFPKVVGPSPGLVEQLVADWSDVLPTLRDL